MWNLAAVPVAALLRLTTAGYLPPILRPRLGIEWPAGRARRFERLKQTVNILDPLLPERIRYPLSGRPAAVACPDGAAGP